VNQMANAGAVRLEHRPDSGAVRVGHFLRHLGEMILAMMIGMVAGGTALVLMFSTILAPTIGGMTRLEVLNEFAVLICLIMAIGMTLPMVAWMRFRGMAWRPTGEMAVAMVIPLVPIFGLLALGIIRGASACGLYCAVMIPAMVLAMLFRFDLYTTGHARHPAPAA
jgi:hypothetical protein